MACEDTGLLLKPSSPTFSSSVKRESRSFILASTGSFALRKEGVVCAVAGSGKVPRNMSPQNKRALAVTGKMVLVRDFMMEDLPARQRSGVEKYSNENAFCFG
jgi:hypothetical protein